jgi:hypothetical protein
MDVMFVETSVFTRRIIALGLEEPLRELQVRLLENPNLGDVDPATGGLRKVRMSDPARGKGSRSGARVHYLSVPHLELIQLIFVYTKESLGTLTQAQKQALKAVVRLSKKEFGKGPHG